jgi:hypothetical protein
MEEIDTKKDHLVLYRDLQGKFINFEWYMSNRFTLEDFFTVIINWNNRTRPLDEFFENAKNIRDEIDKALEYMKSATYCLEQMQRLEFVRKS